MFATENPIYFSQKLPAELTERLFQGLNTMSMSEGRIYKVIDIHGEKKFFKAEGFWSSVFHFFFTERMNSRDLQLLKYRVSNEINSHPNNVRLNALIEITYRDVIRNVSTNSTWFFPRNNLWSIFGEEPHRTLINNIRDKEDNSLPITAEELFLIKKISLFFPSGRTIFTDVEKLNEDQAIRNYNRDSMIIDIHGLSQIKNQLELNTIKLTNTQVAKICEAKKLLAVLEKKYNLLDLQSFDAIPGLKNLYQICDYAKYIQDDSDSDTVSTEFDVSISDKKFDNKLIKLIKKIPEFKFISDSEFLPWLEKLDPNDKAFFGKWLKENIEELHLIGTKLKEDIEELKLPLYFCCTDRKMTLTDLSNKLKEEQEKEVLRLKYGFEKDASSPIAMAPWKDAPLSLLFIVAKTAQDHDFYDLSDANDLKAWNNIFAGDWKSPFTRKVYAMGDWFSFLKICRANNLEVNPKMHLNRAFRVMVSDKNVVTKDDWKNFKSICQNNQIKVTKDDKGIFISCAMEDLINTIVTKKVKNYDVQIIEPYLEVLNDSIIQQLALPDIGSLKVSDYSDLWTLEMVRAAIYLWNGLKDSKIITSAPSEALIQAAGDIKADLRK